MTKHSSKRKISRLGSLNKNDGNPPKKEDPGGENIPQLAVEPFDSYTGQLVQRCVIIQRDAKGYGLTVSGDNPVFVQSVKEDGAAASAGVQQGDRIIKVNGTLVTQSNHVEVVKLIKSGSYVALTLLGKPQLQSQRSPGMPQSCMITVPMPIVNSPIIPHHHQHSNMSSSSGQKPSSPTDRITGPQPVDPEKQQQLSNSKIHTIRTMLELELEFLEKLRSEFAKNPGEKVRVEMNGAQKRCRTLEEQLYGLTGVHYDCGMPQSPRSPSTGRSVFEICGNKENSGFGRADSICQDMPPPLPPPRRLPLPHQMSLPSVTVPASLLDPSQPPAYQSAVFGEAADVPPPAPPHSAPPQIFPLSHSLENIQRSNSNLPVPAATLAGGNHHSNTAWVRNSRHLPNKKQHGGPTHSRQRSSPDALLYQTENLRQQQVENLRNVTLDLSRSHSEISKPRHFSPSNSFNSDLDISKRRRGTDGASSRNSSFGTYDSTTKSPRITPPGTPPPPYGSSEAMEQSEDHGMQQPDKTPGSSSDGQLSSGSHVGPQQPIISMEDDDFPSDNESGQADDHGPYNSLAKLWKHPSHLAVFMHYLIINSDPTSLFFYLITDLYKEGNAKEMKKWAYEIHSSFLVPGAPLKINNIDEHSLHEIDNVLQCDLDKEEILRKMFWKARKKAQEELNDMLADFRNKRTLGLGNLFGPPDDQLEESIHDKTKEIKIIESLLVPILERVTDDLEKANDRTCATASSLATLLYKLFGVKSQMSMTLIDRCPTFVAKEKSRIKFLNRNKKNQTVQGHNFVPQHYVNVTYCNHCQNIIWGIGNQGYQCQICSMNIHKSCVKTVEEQCIGQLRKDKKDKKKDRVSGLMENIIGKRPKTQSNPLNAERSRKSGEDNDMCGPMLYGVEPMPDSAGGDRSYSASRVEKLKNRYETLCEAEEKSPQVSPHTGSSSRELTPQGNPVLSEPSTNGDSTKRANAIGRSESLRARREQKQHSFRKRSDPNIPQTKSDVEETNQSGPALHPSASSSSCSSSTRSLDSPSNSLETVSRQTTIEASPTGSSNPAVRRDDSNDSDFEAEADPPNWTESVDWEIVKHLKPKERKRQDVINELFHTERTHVRNLKVLDRVFCRPMVQEQILPSEPVKLLFANLEEILEIHGQFNTLMKAKKRESIIVGDIGEMMVQMFDGQSGENFRQASATFCKNQSIALESLKNRQKKDQKVAQFLNDAEGNPLCRRLQLKDIIPTGMQRLTKYPLLLENLAKYTPPNQSEYDNLMRAVECCKDNLNFVNQAVKEAENQHRLLELQKKLDRAPFDKVDHPIAVEFRSLDLTKHKMVHEGSLTWRINRQKVIDLHVLLLETFLVLLQKQDDKYVLKFHKEETKLTHSPIIKLCNVLTRNVATDKRAFFLVSTSTVGPQIYELVALSNAERKTWFRHITEAAEAYKKREGKQPKRTDQQTPLVAEKDPTEDPTEADVEKTKESLDSQESQEIADGGDASDAGESGDSGEASDVTTTSTVKTGPSEAEESDEGAKGALAGATVGANSSANSLAVSPCGSTASGSGQSPAPQRRFQRVEVLQIAEGPLLIEPSEVVVLQGAVLQTAEPVTTPLEKLRRKDALIRRELEEKQCLLADVLHIPHGEFNHVANVAAEAEGEKDAKDLILASIYQATSLTETVNDILMVNEEEAMAAGSEISLEENPVPGATAFPSPKLSRRFPAYKIHSPPIHKLKGISDSLNSHLTQLLALISQREEERDMLRRELRASREQIHLLHEMRRHTQSPGNSVTQSRPNSYVSVDSSASEHGDTPQQLEDALDCRSISPAIDAKPVPTNEPEDNSHVELFVDAPVDAASACVGKEIEVNVDAGEPVSVADPETSTVEGSIDNPVFGAIF